MLAKSTDVASPDQDGEQGEHAMDREITAIPGPVLADPPPYGEIGEHAEAGFEGLRSAWPDVLRDAP
jgi:hypothetical protein